MLAVKCFNFSETDSEIIFLQLFYPDIHGVLSPVADRVTYCDENFWDRRKALEEKKNVYNQFTITQINLQKALTQPANIVLNREL